MIKLHGTPAEITAQIKMLCKLFGANTKLQDIKNNIWMFLCF